MYSKLIKFICLLVLCCAGYCHGWIYQDKYGQVYTVEPTRERDLKECEEVFVHAFMEAYRDFSEEQLGIQDKQQFLKSAFADVYDDFNSGEQKLLTVRSRDQVVGFAGYKPTEIPGQIYLTQLSVEPDYWRCGIGTELIFSVFKIYDEVKSLVVIPRRINRVAREFYLHLGFTESSYMHPGYDPKKYVGYEWLAP